MTAPTLSLRQLDTCEAGCAAALTLLLDRAQEMDAQVEGRVREILQAVRARGDAALLEYTARFDRHTPATAAVQP